jgi:hypothetical protein
MPTRFIIMHKTNAHWEAGATPSAELVVRVGQMIEELTNAHALEGGEGLRASSQGVRVRFSGGARTVIPGPFSGEHELAAGFTILRLGSIDEAIDWASRQAEILGDREVDIIPVTELWDIGAAPAPPEIKARRYMILRKATPESEAGTAPSPAQRSRLSRLIEEASRAGTHLLTETMKPSARGRRYSNSRGGITFFDGPFIESKELLGGYVIVSAASLEEAHRWAERYMDAVPASEVDVRELE